MPTNLHDRATTQLARFEQLATSVRTRLGEARAERDERHPDPDAVDPLDWPTQLGAVQHLQLARAALAAVREQQTDVRGTLAGIDTPADAGSEGAVLAALLIEESALLVSERHAAERVETAGSLVDDLGALVARADALTDAATAHADWAEAKQGSIDRLQAALAIAPLSTVVADATALLAGAQLAAADARLDALLPTELRARAEARLTEATAVTTTARDHRATAETTVAAADAADRPLDAAVTAADRTLDAAEAALDDYVARSAGRAGAATAVLVDVSEHPDLSGAQVAALAAADRPDAVTAVGEEADLAAAVAAVAAAQRDVDDAIVTTLSADPDADPEAHADVIAARAALNAPALQDPLSAARLAYDDASRDALDAWEVEVPPSLWDALASFVGVQGDLQTLADQTARDGLVTALDDATDALAQALDARDVARRGELHGAWQLAERTAVEQAAVAAAAARQRSYGRGDGPSGRTPEEL